MAIRPPRDNSREALLMLGVAACLLGLITVTGSVLFAEDYVFTGAPSLTSGLRRATSWFAASTLAESIEPHRLSRAANHPHPTATAGVQSISDWGQRYPGDGIGHRAEIRPEGALARFLRETSKMQTRRGWPTASDVAAARFMAREDLTATSTASPP